ncbi:MAG: hypothetical protein RL711_231 [Bacteroidota bacterium]|jgi:hypothetical protein
MLEKEATYYESKINELIKSDIGKFVVIKDDKIIGTYESVLDALKVGYDKFKQEAFFVKQILPMQQPLNFANNYLFI